MPGERQWYVVQTYASYEKRVEADLRQRIAAMNMQDKIFNVLVPTETKIVIKDGKSKEVTRKLYPSYVMVEMILDEQSWYAVRHTPGVTGFIGAGTHPIPLSQDEVDRIMNGMKKDEENLKIEMDLKPGDTVIFTDMDSEIRRYKVDSVELLMPTDVDKVKDSGDDLILYTCTYGGAKRITVRCSYAKQPPA